MFRHSVVKWCTSCGGGGNNNPFVQLARTSIVVPQSFRGVEPSRTNQQVIQSLKEGLIGGSQGYDPEGYNIHRALVQKSSLRQQDQLLQPRKMADSFDHTLIPLGSDLKLRDKYITHMGSIRVGRLLEDMDMFAVHLVFKHMTVDQEDDSGNPQLSPFSIVTALCDRISSHKVIRPDQDVKLSGHVTWVGNSSAESTLHLHQRRGLKQSHDGDTDSDIEWEKVMEAR